MAITLVQLVASAEQYADAQDNAAAQVETGLAGVAADLKGYVPESDNPRESVEFKTAAEAVKVAFRRKYAARQRVTTVEQEGRKVKVPVNMDLARSVVNATDETRAAWAKDSEQKKVWDLALAYARMNWARIADAAFGKASPGSDSAGTSKGKKAPTPDAILANIDAFLAEHGKASPLAKTLADQIRARFA